MPRKTANIRPPVEQELPLLQRWLTDEGLADDQLHKLPLLRVLEQEGDIAALAGIEAHEGFGILRSVLVRKPYRGRGLAATLVRALHELARQQGLNHIYLITEGAAGFFRQLGYVSLPLEQTPEAVQAFRSHQCRCAPCAVAMHLALTDEPAGT